jgi:DNA-binding response OmpR family regulator
MGRILIADGDPHVLLLCRDELQDEGYEVLVATDAREALGLMEQACPDLVVLEVLLPDMSGLETMKIIKGTCRQTPVIFHSTYGLPESTCHFQADGVVLKTHNLDRLKKTVQGLLARRQGRPSGGPEGRNCARRAD